jgi:hypothetical protein
MNDLIRVSPWRISEDGSQFETGQPSTGMVTLSSEQAIALLVTNEPALQDFLRKLSTAMHNRFGDNKFLEETVVAHHLRHPQEPGPKMPDHRTPQTFDKGDGY